MPAQPAPETWASFRSQHPFVCCSAMTFWRTPSLVDAHCRFHKTNPRREAVALGLTEWDRHHQDLTLFMRWYETVQFQYASLLSGLTPDWRHFYTSNLSFKPLFSRQTPSTSVLPMPPGKTWNSAIVSRPPLSWISGFVPAGREPPTSHPTTFLQAARRMRVVGRTEHLFHSIAPAHDRHHNPDRSQGRHLHLPRPPPGTAPDAHPRGSLARPPTSRQASHHASARVSPAGIPRSRPTLLNSGVAMSVAESSPTVLHRFHASPPMSLVRPISPAPDPSFSRGFGPIPHRKPPRHTPGAAELQKP